MLLVASGALISSLQPTTISCVCGIWFVLIGYSLELIPLLVKVAAVNRLVQKSQRMIRVRVKRSRLYQMIGVSIGVIMLYLAIWTALDPMIPQSKFTLSSQFTQDEYFLVEIDSQCASSSDLWNVVVYIILICILIVMAAIATQNR